MLASGVDKALPHWDIGATSSELDEPLEMSHLTGKLSSAVGHEGPLTFTDGAPFKGEQEGTRGTRLRRSP